MEVILLFMSSAFKVADATKLPDGKQTCFPPPFLCCAQTEYA